MIRFSTRLAARRSATVTCSRCAPLLLGLSLVTASACSPESSSRVGEDGGRLAPELDPLVHELFELDLAPGMAVAVVTGDELAYARGFGFADVEARRPVTPETLFYIASTTKAITALAAALLDHGGVLELDAPLSRYIPELQLKPPLSADSITIRDLLTQTHGIRSGGPVVFRTAFTGQFTENQLLEFLQTYEPAESGRAFRYGNLGYNLAGIAIERATGEGWKEVVRTQVLEPLGMSSTTAYMSQADNARLAMPYFPTPEGFRRIPLTKADANMHAAGGHVTSVVDLSRLLEAMLNEGRMGDRAVLPPEVIADVQRPQVVQDREFGPFHRHAWGLGWDIGTFEEDTLLHRFGSYAGYRPHVSFMPVHKIGIAVLVNDLPLGGRLADLVAIRIYDHLLDKPGRAESWAARVGRTAESAERARAGLAEDLARRAERPQETRLPLASYAGTYSNDELGSMVWREADGELSVAMGLLTGPIEVFDGEQDRFRVELRGRGEIVQFLTDDAGEVRGLMYLDREFARSDP